MDIESVPKVLNGSGSGDELLMGMGSSSEVDKLLMKSPLVHGNGKLKLRPWAHLIARM